MATAAQWIAGARLRTLPLAFAPVIAGSAAAFDLDRFSPLRACLALLVAVFLQLGVNYANDYSDGIKGSDTNRVGPLRLVGSGLVEPAKVKYAALGCFAGAMLAGAALLTLSGQYWLVLLGAAALLAAWGYTGGKNPYGYRGLGDLFVFIFFGLVATWGTLYTQAGYINLTSTVFAVALGLFSCALLMANNIRDIPSDAQVGKRTLAVRLGDRLARQVYAAELLAALALTALLIPTNTWFALTLLLLLPAIKSSRLVLSGADGKALIPVLKQAGLLSLTYSLLVTLAVLLA
ncbi:MAG: 1,4-dihydroxy-2-naphthoate polyprenyltransferase [Rothia sp. (in: high G+C Gram-positive bacteria)]|nr:1,4-dihydroxy-2-naphthoate polyprenyltransferase [Rothia sp. (in: high G+C Gram-positive bacteria)]